MKYKMYKMTKNILFNMAVLTLLSACAQQERSSRGLASDSGSREPASMTGNSDWLEKVGDDFGRIAAATSDRAVASGDKKVNTLVKKRDWDFSFHRKSNRFYLKKSGTSYNMLQTSFANQSNFSFAAEGQTEKPITLNITREDGVRLPASKAKCEAELSYWNEKNSAYRTDVVRLTGKSCDKLMQQLRSYVP